MSLFSSYNPGYKLIFERRVYDVKLTFNVVVGCIGRLGLRVFWSRCR
jgi:hypothetical protein